MSGLNIVPTGELLDELARRGQATFVVMWREPSSLAHEGKPVPADLKQLAKGDGQMKRGDFRLFVKASKGLDLVELMDRVEKGLDTCDALLRNGKGCHSKEARDA